MLETAEVRRQLTHRLAELRKAQAQRRAAADAARAAFEGVLEREIAPTVRQFAQALKAEGFTFSVQTPASTVRLVSDRSSDNVIDIVLELGGPAADRRRPQRLHARPPATRGRTDAGAGRGAIASLDGERVLAVLLDVIEPFVER